MSLRNKVLLYKSMIKPVLMYASPVWATAKKCHRKKIQTFQNKTLENITNAPWYVRNTIIHKDLEIDPIDSAILSASHKYFEAMGASEHNIAQIIKYDQFVEQVLKRPRMIHHDPLW
ncbi:hypothetical protein JTE90_013662 [Oedothorax gibbosus]|uniref:RNA-directed DNA polymerase n=1 Tax=Oedothorax gibbosus TaxID=931172 RepID=A0AAV6VD79_9ARAC|nr:hypothetical protein JTE90_013662 [Oedothorax gibbosus]